MLQTKSSNGKGLGRPSPFAMGRCQPVQLVSKVHSWALVGVQFHMQTSSSPRSELIKLVPWTIIWYSSTATSTLGQHWSRGTGTHRYTPMSSHHSERHNLRPPGNFSKPRCLSGWKRQLGGSLLPGFPCHHCMWTWISHWAGFDWYAGESGESFLRGSLCGWFGDT